MKEQWRRKKTQINEEEKHRYNNIKVKSKLKITLKIKRLNMKIRRWKKT